VDALAMAADRLLSDPLFAERLGRQGREKVAADYNWETVVGRVRDHYAAVLAPR
jgi:glycosyltransferase involved in cell wall biosynthesis